MLWCDAQDEDLLSQSWSSRYDGCRLYWYRKPWKGKKVWLHREILKRKFGWTEIPKGLHVDHIDRNTRNNTRANLRLVPSHENFNNSNFRDFIGARFVLETI